MPWNCGLYFLDGTWKRSPNTMIPWRGEAGPGRCCLWHSIERHARFAIEDPVQKLLWGCFLGRKGSEGEILLPLSLSSLKTITFREGAQAASEGAILLPLLLHVIYVQEVLQRFRKSACGSSFLWLLQQPCNQSRAGLGGVRKATTALGNHTSSSPTVQQHSWIQRWTNLLDSFLLRIVYDHMISQHSLLPASCTISVYFSAAQQAPSDVSVLCPSCTRALPSGKTWKKTWGHHLVLPKQVLPYGFIKEHWPFVGLFFCQLLLPKIVLATLEVKVWKSRKNSFKEEQEIADCSELKRVHALNEMSSGLLHFHICLVLQ